MTKAFYIAALLCACSAVVSGQDSSRVDLDQAEIISYRPDRVFDVTYGDSLQLLKPAGGSLADLLQQNGLWNLRTYGPAGTLVTGAEQGLLPDHTTVYWEGIPLNSPSLGLVDLSQIPVALFNDVNAQSQPLMSANPVQSIGPSIELGSANRRSPGAQAGMSLNNLSNLATWLGARYQIGRLDLESKGFHRTNRNEFSYTDPWKQGAPTLQASHNDHRLTAFLQHAHLKITPQSNLSMGLWLQGSEVSLPEKLGSYGQSYATQTDSSLRLMAKLDGQWGKTTWKVKTAMLKEQQHFEDRFGENDPVAIDSRIHTTRWLMEGTLTRFFGDVKLVAQPLVQRDVALSDYYEKDEAEQWQVAAALQGIWFHDRWNIRGLLRQDFIRTNSLPVAQLAIQRTFDSGVLELGTAHIYRLPDINERFWVPGGNPSLAAESGVKSYARIRREERKVPAFTMEIFSHQMKEMIQWIPLDGVFSAVNTGSVAVNGASIQLSKSVVWPNGRGQVHTQLKGEQYTVLPYYFPEGAPNWSARGNVGARVSLFNTTFHTQARFNVNQWNPGIPEFVSDRSNVMHDIGLSHSWGVNEHELNVQVAIQNIWNTTDWSAVYAMPGRVLTLQLAWAFQTKQSTN